MYKIKHEKSFDVIHIEQKAIKVDLMNYGATIKQIQTPNDQGQFEDVLLEYKNPQDYINNSIYLNATIGPVAGRINHGEVKLGQKTIHLDKNQNNTHTLHSSNLALSFQSFQYDINDLPEKTVVRMTTTQSYQGIHYDVQVIYTIQTSNLRIDYRVKTQHDFVFSLTNHAYFNLSGDLSENIKQHIVQINTNQYHILDEDQLSTGRLGNEPLYDFREEKSLDEPLKMLKAHPYKGYDDIYIFDSKDGLQLKAIIKEPKSKRKLSVYSTYDHMVFYTHNNINRQPLKHLGQHQMHYGLCFECQKAPLSYNQDAYLNKNQTYHETIEYQFGCY